MKVNSSVFGAESIDAICHQFYRIYFLFFKILIFKPCCFLCLSLIVALMSLFGLLVKARRNIFIGIAVIFNVIMNYYWSAKGKPSFYK